MPLAPSGSRGYGDYQRVGNFDTGVLWNSNVGTTNVDIFSPIIDMSRSAYVGGVVVCLGNAFQLEFDWTADFVGNVPMGNRAMVLTPLIPSQMQVRIPNLGPFLSITLKRMLGLSQAVIVDAIGTNRVYPVELIPQRQVLVDQQNVTIPNGQSNFYPSDYYAGPATCWVMAGSGSFNFGIQYLTPGGAWNYTDQVQSATTPGTRATMVMPAGAWRVVIFNTGAAIPGCYIEIVPSLTGAT